MIAGCGESSNAPDGTVTTVAASATASIEAQLVQLVGAVPAFEAVRDIVVVKDGRTAFEWHQRSSGQEYRNVASVTKSVTSTLVGIAISEDRLSLDDQLADLLPQYRSRMSAEVAAITLRQLLTMTGGFPDTWSGRSGDREAHSDWVAATLTGDHGPAGKTFAYSDPGVDLIPAILRRATGQSVLEYARAKLFTPLGIPTEPAAEPIAVEANIDEYLAAGFAWPTDPQGNHLGSGFLKLRPQDMAALGQLFLDDGRWRGRQVIPAAWVREATTSHTPAHGAGDGYGYLWWVGTADGDPTYRAYGYGGQMIEVVPSRRLVVVTSSEVDPKDATSHGVSPDVMIAAVDDIILTHLRTS